MIFLLLVCILLITLVGVYMGFPGSPTYLGWKLSGVWANHTDTFQVMIHSKNLLLQGHVVSAQVGGTQNKIVVGTMVIHEVKLKHLWNWSTGKYTDPYTNEEFDLRVRLVNSDKLKLVYLKQNEGRAEIVREEEWNLVNPL